MRARLLRVFALVVKELLALLRDPASRAVLIGPPIIQLIVFGYAATFELHHVPFVVYNQDQGQVSREIVARFAGAPSFDLLRPVHNQQAVEQAIDDKSALMALNIGPNFSADLERGRQAHVQIIRDGRNSNPAAIAMGYAQSIVTRFNQSQLAQHGMKPAVVINPATTVDLLIPVLDMVHHVLVMSVNPGFGGQRFIPYTLTKIRRLKELRQNMALTFRIEVDGGVDRDTVASVVDAGADMLVAGTAVFNGDGAEKEAHELLTLARKADPAA